MTPANVFLLKSSCWDFAESARKSARMRLFIAPFPRGAPQTHSLQPHQGSFFYEKHPP
jgi:hypothetical protein